MQRLLPLDTRLTGFDEWRALVAQLLPEPVLHTPPSGGIAWIVGGAPAEVVVRISHHALSVYEFVAGGSGSRGVALRHNHVGRVDWSRLQKGVALVLTASLIDLARQSRLAKYTVCRSCFEDVPPEDLQDGGVCRWCGEEVVIVNERRVQRKRTLRAAAAKVRRRDLNLRGQLPGTR